MVQRKENGDGSILEAPRDRPWAAGPGSAIIGSTARRPTTRSRATKEARPREPPRDAAAAGKPRPGGGARGGPRFLPIQWLALVWPLMLLAGLEHVRIDPGNTALTPLDFYDYPITHSLVAVLGWSALFGGVFYARRRDLTGAAPLGAGVPSHWPPHALAHPPPLPPRSGA